MKPCKDGKHDLIVINEQRVPGVPETLALTCWCRYCGGIVMDRLVDGRLSSGHYMKMQFPEIAKQLVTK